MDKRALLAEYRSKQAEEQMALADYLAAHTKADGEYTLALKNGIPREDADFSWDDTRIKAKRCDELFDEVRELARKLISN
jgi:hypothetical protein